MKFPKYSVILLSLLLGLFSIGFIAHTYSFSRLEQSSQILKKSRSWSLSPITIDQALSYNETNSVTSRETVSSSREGISRMGSVYQTASSISHRIQAHNNTQTTTKNKEIGLISSSQYVGHHNKSDVVEIRKRRTDNGSTCVEKNSETEEVGNGIFIVITRSVVLPKRRRERLDVIAKTWGKDFVKRGARVIVLTANDSAIDCISAAVIQEPYTNGKSVKVLECITPPAGIDFIKDKARCFEWLVMELLNDQSSIVKNSEMKAVDNSESFKLNPNHQLSASNENKASGKSKMKYLFWCNDHTFVIANNLLNLLTSISLKPSSNSYPLYTGKVFLSGGRLFTSGAAGILLNRKALQVLASHWARPDENPECFPPTRQLPTARQKITVPGNPSFGKVKEPGLLLADCLYLAGISPNRSRDGGGGKSFGIEPDKPLSNEDRFHSYGPQRLVAGEVDEWYLKYHSKYPVGSGGGTDFASGLDCCSENTVSFHYIEAKEALLLYDIISHQNKYFNMDDVRRRALWPHQKDLSYSNPPKADDPMWTFLTKKLKVEEVVLPRTWSC